MTRSILAAAADCHQALAHPVRLRFLAVLRDGRLCVGELQHLSGLALSTVSRHLAELERAGFVEQRKEGRWVWCQLASDPARVCILEYLWQQIAADPTLVRDRQLAVQLRSRRQGAGCMVDVGPCSAPLVSSLNAFTSTWEDAE